MKKKILIIEDEDAIARAEGLVLEGNYDIVFAKDGDTGLDMAKKHRPDLIILDLMLPKRGGYDVCYNIRQDPKLAKTKIIMVTAKNLPIDREKGIFIGADHYITKPFEPEELLTAVKTHIKP